MVLKKRKMKLQIVAFILILSGNLFSQEINKTKIDKYLSYIEGNNGGIGSVSIFKKRK